MSYNSNTRPKPPSIGLRWKVFLYLFAFVAIILVLLWVFTVLLLDDIYSSIILNRLQSSVEILESADDVDDLDTKSSYISHENEMCVYVFKFDGTTAYPIVSVHADTACIIHSIDSDALEKIYFSARRADDKTHVERVPLYGFNSAGQVGNDKLSDTSLPDSIIFARAITFDDGKDGVIYLNCAMTPVDATVKTLRIMLGWISFIALLFTLIVATFISRHISRPIADVNREAKFLAEGSYDESRVRHGYREINELSETLTYAARELTKTDRMKKELIANISHDLRTPLTLIEGYTEMMRDIPGENTPENMQVVIDETKRLSTLVTDLLEVSRMQTGKNTLSASRFDLTSALAETVDRVMKLYEPEGYTIRLVADGEVFVTADKTRMLQVIYNLIGNAVTYTGDDKTVTVTETVKDGVVRVAVTDSGMGIAEEDLPLIWDRYYKVDKVHRRGAGGSGLGLSIVKEILVMHRSRFGVSSTPGAGSTFWFELKTE